ncbi:MAG: DUF2249 domain-containing protein [Sterolibacterium sp.]|nr:DUF2249 domain-containing protein [Sterolibacterium sp.]
MDQENQGNIAVDLRMLAAAERRPLVFERFSRLQPGETLELTHFHHSTPLRYLLLAEAPRGFSWEYLEQGPQCWRIRIRKHAAVALGRSLDKDKLAAVH